MLASPSRVIRILLGSGSSTSLTPLMDFRSCHFSKTSPNATSMTSRGDRRDLSSFRVPTCLILPLLRMPIRLATSWTSLAVPFLPSSRTISLSCSKQEDLAKAVAVTRQTIVYLEKGTYNPSLELAHRVAKVLKTTIEERFVFDE
jgi:putative transcriptional regulator